MITLLVTDSNLNVIGDPLDWADLTVTRNDNKPDAGQVRLTAWPEFMAQLQPGTRLVVIRDDRIWTAGPIEVPQEFEIGIDGVGGGQDAPEPGENTLSFTSDVGKIAGHLTYPDPGLAASSASQPAAYTRTGANAETVLRDLVHLNAGPGALASRRIPKLQLGAVSGVGTSVSLTTRFEELGDVMRTVALAGGDLVFGTQQIGTDIVFTVRARRDLRTSARFSFGLGNLRYLRYKMSAPTVTTAIVGGQGEGTARKFVEVTDSVAEAAWGRVEKLIDQSSVADDSTGQLTAAGQEALASGAQPMELTTVTVDTEDLQAGRDYAVGDLVTVALPFGVEVADYVRSDILTASPTDGETVVSVIGSSEATTNRATVQAIRDLSVRLGRLEAR